MDLITEMDPDTMTDLGMWIWSGILTVVGLALSIGIAFWWQKWRAKRA